MQNSELLKKVGNYLSDCNNYLKEKDKKINIIIFGCFGLNLAGITQRITMDFDIIIEGKNGELVQKLYELAKRNHLKVDIMKDSFLFKEDQIYQKMQFPTDYVERSIESEVIKQWNGGFSNIKVEILNPVDTIITKLLRFETKDQEDIYNILKELPIDENELQQRYSAFRFDSTTQRMVHDRYDSIIRFIRKRDKK